MTKPVGSGVLLNANLKGAVSDTAMEACIDQMIQLNKNAAEVLHQHKIHAVTDITGFGLAGHGCEMARASGVTFTLDPLQIPVFDEAGNMVESGFTTGVNDSSRAALVKDCDLNAAGVETCSVIGRVSAYDGDTRMRFSSISSG